MLRFVQSNKSIHSIPFHYYSNTQQSIAASQMDTNVALKEDEVIGNFKIKKRLGEGGCGVVYKVVDTHGKRYAMKVEPTSRKKTDQLLPLEAQVLKRLQFSPYATEFIQFGKSQTNDCEFRVLVMGLLGPSITQLQDEQPEYKFTIGTVLRVGLQAFRAISFLHSIWFIHRDVKPSNFAIDQVDCRRVYLIDYGLSRSLKKRGCKRLRKPRDDVPFRGTPGYCSLNAHKRKEHGRHDDFWSLIYMLVDLATGNLPWFKHSRASTAVLKEGLVDFEYMKGCPVAFSTILNYFRRMSYEQRPDYLALEQAFVQMMRLRNVNESQPMCWETNTIQKAVGARQRMANINKAQLDPMLSGHHDTSGTWKAYTFSQDSSDD